MAELVMTTPSMYVVDAWLSLATTMYDVACACVSLSSVVLCVPVDYGTVNITILRRLHNLDCS